MAPLKWLTLAGVLVLGACASAAQRRAAETAEIEKKPRRKCAESARCPALSARQRSRGFRTNPA